MITFKDQFDKLTEAYIKDEINPYNMCHCFVGNMLNSGNNWLQTSLEYGYSYSDIQILEQMFMTTIKNMTIGDLGGKDYYLAGFNVQYLREKVLNHPNYENALFTAFSITLDKLKEIHIAHGEKTDDFVFTKRELVV